MFADSNGVAHETDTNDSTDTTESAAAPADVPRRPTVRTDEPTMTCLRHARQSKPPQNIQQQF